MTVMEDKRSGRVVSALDELEGKTMSQSTELGQRVWFPYFRQTKGEHDSGWGLFEVGYVDQHRSRIILETRTDVVTIEPPSIGRVQMDHQPGADEVMIGPAGNKQLSPCWSEVSGAECRVDWSEHPPRFAFVQRLPIQTEEARREYREARGDGWGRPRQKPEPTTPAEAGEGERHHADERERE